MSGNDRIAKNTIYLYFRMLCTIVVSLYTSRSILQTLGVNDYGIYQTVGGVAGLWQIYHCCWRVFIIKTVFFITVRGGGVCIFPFTVFSSSSIILFWDFLSYCGMNS